ncbi:MAG: hypothetical protein LT106_18810 [Burkholderiaceae bacterium]|nr:hypothetical protein [Burkholderiaceae bacterium]
MSRYRLREIDALRRASDEYRDLAQLVARICRENPQGLMPTIRPLFGQRPRVGRRLRRAA